MVNDFKIKIELPDGQKVVFFAPFKFENLHTSNPQLLNAGCNHSSFDSWACKIWDKGAVHFEWVAYNNHAIWEGKLSLWLKKNCFFFVLNSEWSEIFKCSPVVYKLIHRTFLVVRRSGDKKLGSWKSRNGDFGLFE